VNVGQPDEPKTDSFFGAVAPVDLRSPVASSEPCGGEPLRLRAGDVLSDRFVIERLAGSGGMGAVYRALDRLSGSPVALKVIAQRGRYEQRFAQEARVLAELNHPAIVRYVAHGETVEGQPYLAMQWLEGEDLAQRLARSRLTVGESLEVARRVAEGLAAAHGRDVVHRDVKPSNVLLVDGQPARATLLDFGIARTELSGVALTAGPMTGTGMILGTVGYMSPEQAMGEKTLDARTDVFALGCVLFECLIGERVFSGDHIVAVLAKVLCQEAPRMRALRPELPEALDTLVARMLSKDRGSRPEHGSAVVTELVALGSVAGGAPEAGLRPAAGLSVSEQRMTSVIFAVVPDEPQGVSDLVRPYGGDMVRLANGALLVTLGGRTTASEQAVIAAACALDLRDAHPSARIALATGRALTTAGGLPGPVIDQAASLLVHSVSPAIRLDEVTAGLLGERFEVRQDSQGRALMGKRGEAESSRTLLGKATPFVGRDRELGILDLTLRECVDESVARAVLVTGPAGQGKSRLRHEFAARARERGDVRVLMARADPVAAGSSFMMVRQLVRQAVGVREGGPVEEQHARLRAYVAKLCNAEDSGRVADFLGELISAPSSGRPSPELRSARNDPTIMAEWLRRSFGEWLAAECAASPLLLVLEDLHWGDLPSVTYLGEALRALGARPLMLIALARPEVHDAFPTLWKGSAFPELALGGLTPRAAERLVRVALGEGVTPDTVSRIVERADGNAFYLEELTRRVAEGGGYSLPETVLALVQSRLERLEPEVRRLTRAASVFGNVFWQSAVAELLGGTSEPRDLDGWFRSLVEREVFTASRESRFQGKREYTFRHGLLRDAAYAMLTESDRTKGHALAGAWLQAAGERDALTLADHFEHGGEPSRAGGWFLQAASAAMQGGNLEAALRLVDRGLACDPADVVRGLFLSMRAGALQMRQEWAGAADAGREAMRLLPVGSVWWFSAASLVFMAGGFLGDPNLTVPALHAIMSVSVQPEPSGPYADAVGSVCTGLSFTGQFELARSFLERAEVLGENVADPDPAFVQGLLMARGFVEITSGQIGRGIVSLSQARTLAHRAGAVLGQVVSARHCAQAFADIGDRERVDAAAREVSLFSECKFHVDWSTFYVAYARVVQSATGAIEAIAILRSLLDRADPLLVSSARMAIALSLATIGDFDGADREASAVLGEAFVPHTTQIGALAILAHVALHRGQPAEALSLAELGLHPPSSGTRLLSVESFLYVTRAEALHALGRMPDAHAAIREARERIVSIAATLEDPEMRTSYVTNIDSNARTLALAREWLGE
jgi:tetratricopeptide (TPR) repeat protein